MTEQLTFDLPVKASRDRGDFFVSEANQLAVARLDDTAGWTFGKLALVGPAGAGKSHLAQVWAEARKGEVVSLVSLIGRDVAAVARAVAVEMPETGAFPPEAEEALFHLHNHLAANGLPLLLVARSVPSAWPIALPDLKSRMEASEIVRISEPDDALLSAILVKLFADRQLQVAPSLIDWLTKRMERSFAAAQHLVAALDEASLAAGKPVSQKLARQVLDNLHGEAR